MQGVKPLKCESKQSAPLLNAGVGYFVLVRKKVTKSGSDWLSGSGEQFVVKSLSGREVSSLQVTRDISEHQQRTGPSAAGSLGVAAAS